MTREIRKMEEFQIHHQGIIEPQEQIDAVSNSDHKSGLRIKRTTVLYIVVSIVTVMVFILAVYFFARPIEGVWVRQEDDTRVAGMTVRVEKVNGILQGTIIDMNEGIGTFEVGLVKWMDIKKVGFGRYIWYDLIGIGGSSDYYHYEDTIASCTISRGGKRLDLYSPGAGTGKFQIWIKQKDS